MKKNPKPLHPKRALQVLRRERLKSLFAEAANLRKTKPGAAHKRTKRAKSKGGNERGYRSKPERRLQRYIAKTADREVRREVVRKNMTAERAANVDRAKAKATREG